ncbi:MAG: HAMP domain-containing histidine kinase [Schleiferilactobacillus harbinensis]|jgi:signal transduction histidine kinase|nr:HAMP domain-containing histidine kinase [Schleiferilactobacillus harbinensis]MCI1913760.1 HAMP domain-containing histidine kinase [Schleiferilactobacillus harbinensis]
MNNMKYKAVRVRVNRHFSWFQFFGSFFVMSILAAMPGLILGNNWHLVISPQLVWYVIYWILVAAAFSAFTAWQKYHAFDKPLRDLSDAAEKVAGGDFSVYLQPVHAPEKYDYLDAMFANFNIMVAELGSTETLREDFVANVSHEFKRPLANIQGYAQALQEPGLSPADKARYIATINQSATQLAALVTNILKLNKLQTQVSQPTHVPFDLSAQLTRAILDFDDALDQKDLDLTVAIPDTLTIASDPELLGIVWHNIIGNAVKFAPAQGHVKVAAEKHNQMVQVTIQDDGAGMDEATQTHIFDKFYQGDTSHAVEGNGLGLAMVAQIIRLIGAQIAVHSQLGQGTTMIVSIPQHDN